MRRDDRSAGRLSATADAIAVVTPPSADLRASVLCVTNDAAVLDSHLAASLRGQTEPHEWIVFDSAIGRPTSAAMALNAAAARATGRWLIFAHQDVALERPDFLQRFCDLADATPDAGIVGIMGVEAGPGVAIRLVNRITQGSAASPWVVDGRAIDAPADVETVDELLFAIRRDDYARQPLDEAACPHWDLYAVDYSLTVRAAGRRAVVLPLSLRHRSVGKVRGQYYATLERVIRKHRGTFARIFTTCGTWRTDRPVAWQRAVKTGRAAMARATQFVGKLVATDDKTDRRR